MPKIKHERRIPPRAPTGRHVGPPNRGAKLTINAGPIKAVVRLPSPVVVVPSSPPRPLPPPSPPVVIVQSSPPRPLPPPRLQQTQVILRANPPVSVETVVVKSNPHRHVGHITFGWPAWLVTGGLLFLAAGIALTACGLLFGITFLALGLILEGIAIAVNVSQKKSESTSPTNSAVKSADVRTHDPTVANQMTNGGPAPTLAVSAEAPKNDQSRHQQELVKTQ